MTRFRVLSIVGTRPEVIKMAPVAHRLAARNDAFEHYLVATAQHRQLLDQVLALFRLTPDIDLGLMQHNQQLADYAARSLTALSKTFAELRPDAVLIQGDTTTVMTAALAAFYQNIRVGHVEAGLRSFDSRNPFPEEINRRVAGCLADWHFAPTEGARRNLLAEGVNGENIVVTGNTVVDALQSIRLPERFECDQLNRVDYPSRRVVLVTAHRRENHGKPLASICDALVRIADNFGDVEIVYPVHPNPNVDAPVRARLEGTDRVRLVDPISYSDLLLLMSRCFMVLTDSGGIQEEAPSFRKPVLVLREVTERPELIEAGAGRLVGTDTTRIVEEVSRLLNDAGEYKRMSQGENPFGDGHAADRIVSAIIERLAT